MLTIVLIVLALVVLGVVIWAVRRKPAAPPAGPAEADTAWNDPVTPGEIPAPRETVTRENAPSTPPRDPRP